GNSCGGIPPDFLVHRSGRTDILGTRPTSCWSVSLSLVCGLRPCLARTRSSRSRKHIGTLPGQRRLATGNSPIARTSLRLSLLLPVRLPPDPLRYQIFSVRWLRGQDSNLRPSD